MVLTVPPQTITFDGGMCLCHARLHYHMPFIYLNMPSGWTTNHGTDWWVASGIAYAGLMLVISNAIVPGIVTLTGVDRLPMIWIAARGATTQAELDKVPLSITVYHYC